MNAHVLKAAQVEPQPADRGGLRIEAEADFRSDTFSPIKHNYHQHPLLQLDQLEQLALRLAAIKEARFIMPGTKPDSEFKHEAFTPDRIAEVFRRIEEPGSWIALYNIQLDEVYRKFLWEEAYPSFSHLIKNGEKIYDIRGFIFISAPPSVTPFHIDRENNFWVNIRGRKTISLWDWRDRDIVSGKDLEDFIAYGALHNVKLTDLARSRANEFNCGPGEGVYFPSTTPHMAVSNPDWVKPGDGVSISMGTDFYSNVTRRNANIHLFNQQLRRLGITPVYPSNSRLVDMLKYAGGKAFMLWRKHVKGYKPKPGF